MEDRSAPIYVAGHGGLVGSAIWRALESAGYENLVGWRSSELDLTDRQATVDAIAEVKPAAVVLAAARVGGIMANSTKPVEFLNDNLLIQTNVFEGAHLANVDKLLFLGSSCIYPKLAPQPILESALMTGPLEPTNDAYAIAKIAGIIGIQAYRREYGRHWISVMPTNLYGPGDNFDLQSSHVLPAMMRKFHDAKVSGAELVTLWGSGSPRREFLHVNDCAGACLFLLKHYDSPETINVGIGEDLSIKQLAEMIATAVGFTGRLGWDTSKPDGTPRKLLDTTKLRALGWKPSIPLDEGIASTYEWFKSNLPAA